VRGKPDNLLADTIARTYRRCAIRYSNPIPTLNDLREELWSAAPQFPAAGA